MQELPFGSIEQTPDELSSTNVMSRFAAGLGFRYRWATEGLTPADYAFRPHESSMNIHELLEHLYSMANYANHRLGGDKIDDTAGSSEELRAKTLAIYAEMESRLRATSDSEFEIQEKLSTENGAKTSFWLMLNGPISDSLTHVGQVTSWRRISGNPQPIGVDVFRGRTDF